MPGRIETHQACSMSPRPSATITPHDGVGGGIPTPRNDNAASSTMTYPTWSVASTRIEGIRFGTMWRSMIVRLEQPAMRASATNSCCLRPSVSPRTRRA